MLINSQEEIVKIYSLVNPLTGKVFYVGASIDPEKRLRAHICLARKRERTDLDKAINAMVLQGSVPVVYILHQCKMYDAEVYENKFIEHYTSLGLELVNRNASSYPQRERVYGLPEGRTVQIWLDARLMDAIRVFARENDQTISDVIIEAIKKNINFQSKLKTA